MMAASNLGTVVSLVLLEVGLRAKSHRAWAIVVGCIALVLAWESYCWITYAMMVRSMYLASEWRIVGPSEGQLFWMQAGPYFFIAIIPALVLRSVWSRRGAVG